MKNNKRYLESLAPHFTTETQDDFKTIIMIAPHDEGVIKNGGRNGARYAPEALLNCLKKMNNHIDHALPALIQDVFPGKETDLESNQISSSELIDKAITLGLSNNLIHIGGGHDHAYPFLRALELNTKIKNILVINLDAHCDTRIDDNHHSGTPFRNFTDETKKNIHLVQYGLHNFANGKSTLAPLKNGSEKHFFIKEARENSEGFNSLDKNLFSDLPFELGEETFIYLSLDCDAIESATMEAVSAVNHEGLPLSYIQLIIGKVKTLPGPKAFGLYEYNPIYDNLSQKGARALCSLIYNYIS